MPRPRSILLGVALVIAMLVPMGCASSRAGMNVLPADLPANPEACTSYCKVWVDPVYRDKPVLCQTKPGCTETVPETVMKTRYREVCEQPTCYYDVRMAGKQCDQAVVQVSPGGYKWKRDGQCWKYCYEEPCYQWCNKVVQEDGIEYCMEVPAEYRVEAYHEPVTRYRSVRTPPEYGVKWVKELYTPGHYEWQPTKNCTDCDCPGPCAPVPMRKSPCPDERMIAPGCPRSN
jgi:hypothetical protein